MESILPIFIFPIQQTIGQTKPNQVRGHAGIEMAKRDKNTRLLF